MEGADNPGSIGYRQLIIDSLRMSNGDPGGYFVLPVTEPTGPGTGDACSRCAASLELMSMLPLKLAPSSKTTRGARMLPLTVLACRKISCSSP